MQFSPNTPTIAIENFDNEIIIVNLEKGNYYSLRNSAFDIWNLLMAGNNLDTVISIINEAYSPDPEYADEVLTTFLNSLINESLIIPAKTPTPIQPYSLEQANFQAPLLEVFTDMQELLLLDPIHEVKPEEQGWPFKK